MLIFFLKKLSRNQLAFNFFSVFLGVKRIDNIYAIFAEKPMEKRHI